MSIKSFLKRVIDLADSHEPGLSQGEATAFEILVLRFTARRGVR